jgi:hypothetical protein
VYRIADGRHVVRQPARHQQQVVVDHITARQLERLDQVERRLFAEHAGQHHPAIVPHRPVFDLGRGQILFDDMRGAAVHRLTMARRDGNDLCGAYYAEVTLA